MKTIAQLLSATALFVLSTVSFCNAQVSASNSRFSIASDEYSEITEQYLQHLAHFEWEKSYTYLAENVVFKLPDGDTDTRTSFKGKEAVMGFWNSYQEKSGNDKAVFKNFVHAPIRVNEIIEHIGTTGVFDLCYFSAELHYGAETTNVRMHWAIHFDNAKKIDGIFTYYDRTPIIEAAKKNFLTMDSKVKNDEKVIQIIRIKSDLPEAELMNTAKTRAHNFREIPGLLQKYYIRLGQPGEYGGVYVWDCKASMEKFLKSSLASNMASAYKVLEAPNVEINEVLYQLRD